MATITEDYVSFKTAKLLKKKGFNEECEYFYDEYEDEDEYVICSNGGSAYNDDEHPTYYSMPTLQMAMKWLREVYKIFITILFIEDTNYFAYTIENLDTKKYLSTSKDTSYNNYEEACEAAILYCLKNLIK